VRPAIAETSPGQLSDCHGGQQEAERTNGLVADSPFTFARCRPPMTHVGSRKRCLSGTSRSQVSDSRPRRTEPETSADHARSYSGSLAADLYVVHSYAYPRPDAPESTERSLGLRYHPVRA